MKVLAKILAVFAIIQISACEFTGNTGNRKTTPNETVKIVATIEDSLEGSNVRIEEIYAHYENKTKECTSGGMIFGAVQYPTKVVFLSYGDSAYAKELIDTEKRCPLKLVGFSAKISTGHFHVNSGFSLDRTIHNEKHKANCYYNYPPGFCDSSEIKYFHEKEPKGWFASISFSLSSFDQ